MPVTSNRPYLLRALNEWILDNGLTPHILVDVDVEGVDVPRQYEKEGKLVLNISPMAVRELQIRNESLDFSARFDGISRDISIPMAAVMAVYARENGMGMFFPEENTPGLEGTEPVTTRDKTHLKVIK